MPALTQQSGFLPSERCLEALPCPKDPGRTSSCALSNGIARSVSTVRVVLCGNCGIQKWGSWLMRCQG